MNNIINAESAVSVIGTFLKHNSGDESTEELIISIGCELLDVSQDRLIEMIDE